VSLSTAQGSLRNLRSEETPYRHLVLSKRPLIICLCRIRHHNHLLQVIMTESHPGNTHMYLFVSVYRFFGLVGPQLVGLDYHAHAGETGRVGSLVLGDVNLAF